MPLLRFLNGHILDVSFYLRGAILLVLLFLQIRKSKIIKTQARELFFYTLGIFFVYLAYVSILQYKSFSEGPLLSVINIQSGFTWFLSYIRLHYWDEYIFSLIGALLFYLAGKYLNDAKDERFFEKEEIWLGMLGIFIVGYPAWFFYIALMLVVPALLSLVFLKNNERLPLYYFWIPTALFVILIVHYLLEGFAWWGKFII